MNRKVTVVGGAGNVGATVARAIAVKELADVVIVDIAAEKAAGIALDIFEATHGTAPKYANQDKVNPGSVILSGEMMLRFLGWPEAADLVMRSLERAIASKQVTYDLARLMEGAKELKTSEFADVMIKNM